MTDSYQGRLDKADRAVRAATLLLENGYSDFAASRASYAFLYTASALLNEESLETAEHFNLYGQLRERFARSRTIDECSYLHLEKSVAIRHRVDYDVTTVISDVEARALIEQARHFVDSAQRHFDSARTPARRAA